MQPQFQIIPTKKSNNFLVKFLIVLTLLVSVIIGGLAIYLWIKSTNNISPVVIPPINGVLPSAFESCAIKKNQNPLVTDVRTLSDGTIIGTFYGNINYLSNNGGTDQELELISPKGDQSHYFKVKLAKGLVYDSVKLKDLSYSNLKRGQTVVMSFNCFPKNKEGEKFVITQIALK